MPSAIKEKQVGELTDALKDSKHIVVTEYQGLAAGELDELRAALRPLGASYKVVKNRLAKLAFEKTGYGELNDALKGPSAIVYRGGDPAAIARTLFKFGEKHTNLKVRAGHVYGSKTDGKSLRMIANLPSREVLLATLLSRMNSPLQTLMATLNEPLRSLHAALTAVGKKKEGSPA